MVLESDPITFLQWFNAAWPSWLLLLGGLVLVATVGGFLLLAVRDGPAAAGDRVYSLVVGTVVDLVRMSPRRVWAMARLAMLESLRGWILIGFAIFGVVLLFAVFFVDSSSVNPGGLYIKFVYFWSMLLVLVMALLISAFSLPNDLKHRTIYTVVTKPVRASEIVLGRMLGFSLLGTAALVVMAGVGYLFVVRSVNHTHELTAADLVESTDLLSPTGSEMPAGARQGRTSRVQNHRHRVTIDADGVGRTEVAQGHWHEVSTVERDGQTFYVVGPPRGQFHARVPIYGQLHFKDRAGADVRKGLNVGNIWTYRSYVEGGTLAAAVWRFEGLRPEAFPDGLPVEMTLRVFRTRRGEEGRGILGSLVLRNPRTGVATAPRNFVAREFYVDQQVFPRQLSDPSGKPLDLFADLVHNGTLEIQLQCLPRAQFFGVARGDLYLLPREASFDVNFAKGFVGIWLQMLLVVAVGVMWSTFLNGPVALLATLFTIVTGFSLEFIQKLASGEIQRGGTFESMVRIFNQKSEAMDLDDGLATRVITVADTGIQWFLGHLSQMLPDLISLVDVDYLAYGFDIPPDRLWIHALGTLGYLVPVFLIGLVMFKTREVAR